MNSTITKVLRNVIPVIILLGGIAGSILLQGFRAAPPPKDAVVSAPSVTTSPVETCTDGFKLSVDGEVSPFREITLSAEVRGRIRHKHDQARAGSFVKAGDTLFEIDTRDYDLEVRRLQATVKQASVSIEEVDIEKSNNERLIKLARSELKLQQREVARFRDLKRRQAASEAQLETAQRNEIKLLNSLQTLQNQNLLVDARRNRIVRDKETAVTALDKARLDLQRTKIVAPIDGVVMMDMVEQDDFVQPGTVLVRIEDTAKVEVTFNLRMEELRWLWSGVLNSAATRRLNFRLPPRDVHVIFELDGKNYQWKGVISRYDGSGINPATRTVPCVAVVEEPWKVELVDAEEQSEFAAPPTLMRGSFVSVEIPIPGRVDLIQIPVEALRPNNEVWVVRNNRLFFEPVRVAFKEPNGPVVLFANASGVAVNERVVTSPIPMVAKEMAVQEASPNAEIQTDVETLTSSKPPTEAI